MFGTNPVRKRSEYTKGQYRVQEIFYTLQGEGPFAGCPAVFVRLAGCNLRCHFCDTDFESNFDKEYTAAEIIEQAKLRAPDCRFIVLTGGEPMIQNLVPLLDEALLVNGYHVQIETAGTVWQAEFENWMLQDRLQRYHNTGTQPMPGLWSIVVSPKTPTVHRKVEDCAIAFKYIVSWGDAHLDDGLPYRATQPKAFDAKLSRPAGDMVQAANQGVPIYVQPMDVPDPKQREANIKHAVDIALVYGYRLCLQLHKMVGLP